MGVVRGLLTLVMIIAFAGVVFWAWSSRRRKDFEAAARMPLEDEPSDKERS